MLGRWIHSLVSRAVSDQL
uniref:Uncharacterized protein n=1 Tax=Arundo donax TaxID=35708 RepID=A0A0A9HDL5_ARUDO